MQQIQATQRAFAAVLADGSVITWGCAGSGGDSLAVRDQLRVVEQIQATQSAFAAILADGSVVSWGDAKAGGDSSAVQDQHTGIGEALHLFRCSWREKQFEKWLHQKRREPQQMLQTHTKEQLLGFYRCINLKDLRSCINDNGWFRHVVLGAVVSPAAYAVMTSRQDLRCPYCSHPNGTWEHMAWHCAHFAEGRPRQKPDNPLVARFGWPLQLDEKGSTYHTLNYLAKVACRSCQ